MIRALTDDDLARLHAKFVVPLAVSGMLRGDEELDDGAEYALQDIIAQLQPDTALLCMALCAQHIAIGTSHVPVGRALGLEAGKLVEEYGPLWLAHEAGKPDIDPDMVDAAIAEVPGNLELMRDLFEAACGVLGEEMAVPAILCDILARQADMHREYAELALDRVYYSEKPGTPTAAGSNVIPFPLRPLPAHA